jgi:anti-anti-sigma regulatory factor
MLHKLFELICGSGLAVEGRRRVVVMSVNVERVGELSVVECDGRIVRSDTAFALRDSVTSQADARVIVLDLSEANALEGGGLGMLIFLQRWAQDHQIQLKLFNPRSSVRARLECNASPPDFDILSVEELLQLLAQAEHGNARLHKV